MSNKQEIKVPAQLVNQLGTGVDIHGLIGKRIRTTDDHPGDFLAGIFGGPMVNYNGAEGTIIHIDAEGGIWADFDGNDQVLVRGGESAGSQVWDISANDVPEEERIFEVIG